MAMGRYLAPGGTSLSGLAPYWILGLILLYPLARWYGPFKGRQPPESPVRLF